MSLFFSLFLLLIEILKSGMSAIGLDFTVFSRVDRAICDARESLTSRATRRSFQSPVINALGDLPQKEKLVRKLKLRMNQTRILGFFFRLTLELLNILNKVLEKLRKKEGDFLSKGLSRPS
jgi:hypothetical protein